MASHIQTLDTPLLKGEIPPARIKITLPSGDKISRFFSSPTPGSLTMKEIESLDQALCSRNPKILTTLSNLIPEGQSVTVGQNTHTKQSLRARVVDLDEDPSLNPLFLLDLLDCLEKGEEVRIPSMSCTQTMDWEALYAAAGAFANRDTPQEETAREQIKGYYEAYAVFTLQTKIQEMNKGSPHLLRSIQQVAMRGIEQFPNLPILYELLRSTLIHPNEKIEYPAHSGILLAQSDLHKLAIEKMPPEQNTPKISSKTSNPISSVFKKLFSKATK